MASPELEIRLVVLFPSEGERVAVENGLRAAAARMTPFDASNRCVAIPQGVDDAAWVVRDNAMILLGPAQQATRAQVDAAFDAAEAFTAAAY
jgi:hypothetical protein